MCIRDRGDTFANTVQKARRFAATTEVPRTRKSVRITTPPAHEAVQLIKENSVLEKRLDKIEGMIQSLQVTGISAGRETPPPKLENVACVTKQQPQRQFPTSQPSGEGQDRGPRSNQKRRPLFVLSTQTSVAKDRNRPRQTDPLVGLVSLQGGALRTGTRTL